MITFADVVYLLSGGFANADPLRSLGGDPSVARLTTGLFKDISPAQASLGLTDYRCVYIANDSGSDSLYGIAAYTDEATAGGAAVDLGFFLQNDIQQVSVDDGVAVTGGSVVFQYEGVNFTVGWASGIDAWAANFQAAIRAIPHLEDVVISGGVNGNTSQFQINFTGAAGHRYHPPVNVITNSLASGSFPITVLKIFNGSPINSLAGEIDAVTTTPSGISFAAATPGSPAVIGGDLRPSDILPIWMRRVCPPNFSPLADDGFSLKLKGNPFSA